MSLLKLDDLHVEINELPILRGITLSVEAGKTLGVVGESGSGKSMLGLTLMGMLPAGGKIVAGSAIFDEQNLAIIKPKEWLNIRGEKIAMIMQDPFTSLNPVMKIGDQVSEVFLLHRDMNKREAWREAIKVLGEVGIPDPESSARKYPHQMSGGQRQRVVIAIAFACRPKLLIADEPTTALDVTLQAQILRLLKDLQQFHGTAVILISHNIGVIASVSDNVAVMYAGQLVEQGTVEQVLKTPAHPYTVKLLAALPGLGKGILETIHGQPPQFTNLPKGCAFSPRCTEVQKGCELEQVLLNLSSDQQARCIKYKSNLSVL